MGVKTKPVTHIMSLYPECELGIFHCTFHFFFKHFNIGFFMIRTANNTETIAANYPTMDASVLSVNENGNNNGNNNNSNSKSNNGNGSS